MITIQASVSKNWLHCNAGFVFDEKYYLHPLYKYRKDKEINEYLRKRFPNYAIYNMEDNLVLSDYYSEESIQIGAIQPNMLLAVSLGAEFSFFEDKDADVMGFPLQHINSKDELPPVETLTDSPFIRQLTDRICEYRALYPEKNIIPPFFWDMSGRAVIHGIITTSLKLVGENIMMLSVIDPKLTHAIHLWITKAYIRLIRHFSETVSLPVTSVHVGECSGTMLSSEMFSDLVVPYISILGDELGRIRLHSCGKTDYLLTSISKIRNLSILDTGSGTSVAEIRNILGNEIEINIFPSVSLLMQETPKEKVQEWLHQVIKDNNGGPLKIAYHLEESYNIDNCLFIHDELEKMGLITNGRLY